MTNEKGLRFCRENTGVDRVCNDVELFIPSNVPMASNSDVIVTGMVVRVKRRMWIRLMRGGVEDVYWRGPTERRNNLSR